MNLILVSILVLMEDVKEPGESIGSSFVEKEVSILVLMEDVKELFQSLVQKQKI